MKIRVGFVLAQCIPLHTQPHYCIEENSMALPDTITHQGRLLSTDTNLGKFVEGMHPGITAPVARYAR